MKAQAGSSGSGRGAGWGRRCRWTQYPEVERNCYGHTGKAATGTDTDLWSSELSAAKCMERHGCSGKGKCQFQSERRHGPHRAICAAIINWQALGWALVRKLCSQNVSVL